MKSKHPKVIERWIDFNDPPPVLEEVPGTDPGDLVKDRNEFRIKAWEERKRLYLETYFLLIASAAILVGTAWAIYSSL